MLSFSAAMIGVSLGLVSRWLSPAPGVQRDTLIAAALAASGSLGFVWVSYFYDWCCGIPSDWHSLVAAATGALTMMLIRYVELHPSE